MVERLLPSFTGEIAQVPPMFSALKRDGVPLTAMPGRKTVERPPRPVRVYQIELTEFQPPTFTIEVKCGRGFYLRTLRPRPRRASRLRRPFGATRPSLRGSFLPGHGGGHGGTAEPSARAPGSTCCALDSVNRHAAILGEGSRQSACLGTPVESTSCTSGAAPFSG